MLTEVLKWAGVAAGLLVGSGVTAAAIVEGLKNMLVKLGTALPGVWAGYLASGLTVLVTAWTLFTAQSCPWYIAVAASVVAFFMPHFAYNSYAYKRAMVNVKPLAAQYMVGMSTPPHVHVIPLPARSHHKKEN
jgi:hypothetical protein